MDEMKTVTRSNGITYALCTNCGGRVNLRFAKLDGLCSKCRIKPEVMTVDVARIFEDAKAKWEPVEKTIVAGYFRWHDDSASCLLSGRDCSHCNIPSLTGRTWGADKELSKCYIPQAVQALLDTGKTNGFRSSISVSTHQDEESA